VNRNSAGTPVANSRSPAPTSGRERDQPVLVHEVCRRQRVYQAEAADHDDVPPAGLLLDPGEGVALDRRRVRPHGRIDAGPGGHALRHRVHQPGEVPVAAGPEPGETLPGPAAVELDAALHPDTEPELVLGDRPRPYRKAQPPYAVPDRPSGSDTTPSTVEN
jgi:hypothetical protein